jgi:hypothetical protein
MANSVENILSEFDQVLSDEKSLNTRSGLRFTVRVLREAFAITAETQNQLQKLNDRVDEIERERNAEKEVQKKHNENEQWWKRTAAGTALAALVMVIFNGLVFLFSTIPLINKMIETAKP